MSYKTICVDADLVRTKMGVSSKIVNGDQLARIVQATLDEQVQQGFELDQSIPITSSQSSGGLLATYTTSILLIFRRRTV